MAPPRRIATVLVDFGSPDAAGKRTAIDVRVMSGVSRTHLRHVSEGHALFSLQVSLRCNGSFTSVRADQGPLGRTGATACLIDIRGDGKRYKL